MVATQTVDSVSPFPLASLASQRHWFRDKTRPPKTQLMPHDFIARLASASELHRSRHTHAQHSCDPLYIHRLHRRI
jgi:hypothetical protein